MLVGGMVESHSVAVAAAKQEHVTSRKTQARIENVGASVARIMQEQSASEHQMALSRCDSNHENIQHKEKKRGRLRYKRIPPITSNSAEGLQQ